MYIPAIYKNENPTEIRNFINDNGFAILINITNNKLWGTHIPLILDINENGKEVLLGHVSKENPQACSLLNNEEVLVIFSGAHSYISSSWYDHENVPTWNYLAVHVYGKVNIFNEEKTIISLKKLVDKYEKKSENPIKIENLSMKTMFQTRGIAAFEIEISSIEAIKKISQNRDSKNYKSIISELEKNNDSQSIAMSAIMKNDIL